MKLDTHWYKSLVEEIKGTITEGVFTSRIVLIETYHKVGQDLRKASDVHQEAITDLVNKCARDIGVSDRKLWYAVKFFDKYPDMSKLPHGKAISWNKIKTELLTEVKEKEECKHEEVIRVCKKCKEIIN